MAEALNLRRPGCRLAFIPILLIAVAAAGCLQRPASMVVSTRAIDFGNQLNSATFSVKNAGKDGLITAGVIPLEYEIKADKSWLTIAPATGKCGEGQENTHVVELNRALLASGVNMATISIASNDDPVSIVVRAESGSTSCSTPPTAPGNPAPGNGATQRPISVDLAWSDGASQCAGLTATYDVRFGTSATPPFVQNTGTSKSWDPGTLANGTTYYWQIIAKDANGSTPGPMWSFTTAAGACTAGPGAVALVAPGNGATSVSIDQNLSWSGGASQCAGLTATYDVRFGTSPTPPFDHNNGSSKSWDPGTLANGTTYYWQIVAKDANGSTPGPVWSFTTSAAACTAGPGAVTLVAPGNGALLVPIDQNLTWGGGASQCPGLTATYDVRFGTSPTPPFVQNNGTSKTWDPGTLATLTTYYWQIIAKDANGSTPGPVWSFTTNPPCVTPPTAACNPSPAAGAEDINENANLAWGCGVSLCTGSTATYDVYFGTNPTPGPGELLGNTAAKVWELPRQAKNTTYYWKIVTKDASGTTSGPIWSFKTRD